MFYVFIWMFSEFMSSQKYFYARMRASKIAEIIDALFFWEEIRKCLLFFIAIKTTQVCIEILNNSNHKFQIYDKLSRFDLFFQHLKMYAHKI